MNSKTQALYSAVLAAITGLLAYIAQIPTDAQAGFAATLANMFPPTWRGEIGSILKTVSVAAGMYATYRASHSGPTPAAPPTSTPVNPPQ